MTYKVHLQLGVSCFFTVLICLFLLAAKLGWLMVFYADWRRISPLFRIIMGEDALTSMQDGLFHPSVSLPLGLHVVLQAEHYHDASLMAIVATMRRRPGPRPQLQAADGLEEKCEGVGEVAADSSRD